MILIAAAIAVAAPNAGPVKPIPYPRVDLSACSGANDVGALTCRAMSAEKSGNFIESATEFEELATRIGDGDAAARDRAWSAAGNMWIAASRTDKAIAAIDKALAGQTLTGSQLGLTQLDRARAAEAKGDLKTARTMIDQATVTISGDPFLYYFSAVVAQREGDLPRARSAINRAVSLAPASSEVLLEAGNIAHGAGDDIGARDFWSRATAAGPQSAAGMAAQEQMRQLDIPLTVTNQVATRPNGDGEGEDKPQD